MFKIDFQELCHYRWEIEAKNKEEAEKIAQKFYNDAVDEGEEYNDCDPWDIVIREL